MIAVEQARALLWLRLTLWRRRLVQERGFARLLISIFALVFAGAFSLAISTLVLETAAVLEADPGQVSERGGPLAIFATWLTLVLVGRVWFALISAGQMASFLDPKRFLVYAVPAKLMSVLNMAAQALEPVWLVLYAPLVCIAIGISRLQGAPALWALLVAEAFAVFAVIGLLHLGAAIGAAFDARPFLRRGFSVVLLFGGFAAFQFSVAKPGRPGVAELFAGHHWQIIAWTPPGWTALLAQALSDGRPLHALTPALLLGLIGLFGSIAAHRLGLRDALRPAEAVQAPVSALKRNGWNLPLATPAFSALFEKEAKTVVRIGWLQLVLVPVGYLMLRSFYWQGFVGRQPLLVAAAYAHLGVLEIATNAFGRDVAAARAYFLWPVSRRALLLAKNAVAYFFSLAIFACLSAVALASARVTFSQVLVGLCAHAAIFPIMATFGNVSSVLFPSPVRGARLRRVRGAGPVGARFMGLGLLFGGAWAPYWIAHARGLPLYATYLGELVAMALAYGGLLAFAAHLLESRREQLLSALAKDE